MKRRLLIGALLLLVVLGVLVAALGWLGWTESGLRFALRLAAPDWLQIEHVGGRLVGPIEFDGLRLETAKLRIDIEHGRLDWQPRNLLDRAVRVHPLELRGVALTTRAGDGAPRDGPLRIVPPVLPVALYANSVQIDAASWQHADREPLILDQVELDFRYDDAEIAVDQLRVSAPDARAEGLARLGLHGAHPVAVALDWRLRPPDQWSAAEFAGVIRVDGDLDELHVDQTLSAPFDATLSGELREPLADLAYSATLRIEALHPAALRAGWPDHAIGLALSSRGTLQRIELDGSVHVADAPIETLDFELAGRWHTRRLLLERLVLRHAEATIEADGELALAGGFAYQGNARWDSLGWPLDAEPWIASPQGELSIAGDLERYRGQISARLAPRGNPPAPLQARFDGDRRSLHLNELHAELLGGELSGNAHIGWSTSPVFAGVLQARGLDPALLAGHLEGRIDVDLRGNALVRDGALAYSVALERLRGTLNDQPITGHAQLDGRPGRLAIGEARIEAGDNRIAVNGNIDERYDIDWQIEANAIGLLLPDAAGELRSTGRLSGPRNAPTLTGELVAHSFRLGDYRVEGAQASGEMDLAGGEAAWKIELQSPAIGELRFERFEAAGTSTGQGHRVVASLQSQAQRAELGLGGLYADERWSGEIDTLSVDTGEFGRWTLQRDAAFVASREHIELGALCLQNGASRVCAQGDWSARTPWRFNGSAESIELARLAPWLPQGFEYAGGLTAQAAAHGAPGQPWTAEGRIDTQALGVSQTIADEQVALLEIEQGTVTAQIGAERIDASVALELAGEDRISGELRLERRQSGDAAVAGELRGTLSDLSLLPLIVPQVAAASGSLNAALSLGGTRAAPVYRGQLSIDEGRINLIDLGITVRDVRLRAEGGDGALSIDGRGRSGDGEVQLSGQLAWATGPARGRVRLQGEQFRIVSLPEARIAASPDLTLDIAGRDLTLDGRVSIPTARLNPEELTGAVRASGDEIIVGREQAQSGPGWRLTSRLQLDVGDDVQIDAFGLESRLQGRLRLLTRPETVTTASGELQTVGGTYRAYGQELKIERGRLVYNGGPIGDPGLDVRAVREAEEVKAGVDIRGTLRDPQLTLFSEPALPQTEAMSYLLFGRSSGTLSESDQQLAGQAASSLALKGGVLLAERLGRNLGLKDVTVEAAGAGEDAALVLGKYLSPQLYVSYGIGLYESIDTFRVRYKLTDHWSLEAESGLAESADLLYSIER